MPYKSKAQQRKFFAMEAKGELPKGTARKWADHTTDIKKLPERVTQEKEGSLPVTTMIQISEKAVEAAQVSKFASVADIAFERVYEFAAATGLTPVAFVKQACADPEEFNAFLREYGKMEKEAHKYGFGNGLYANAGQGSVVDPSYSIKPENGTIGGIAAGSTAGTPAMLMRSTPSTGYGNINPHYEPNIKIRPDYANYPVTLGALNAGAGGILGAVPGALAGGVLGAGYGAAKGRTGTGAVRGATRGALTGGGALAGGALASSLTQSAGGSPAAAALASLAGMGLGGYAGWKGTNKLIGKDLEARKPEEKTAGIYDKLLTAGRGIVNAGEGAAGKGPLTGGFFGKSPGEGWAGKAMEYLPFGKSQAGRAASSAAVGAAGAGTAYGLSKGPGAGSAASKAFNAPVGTEIANELPASAEALPRGMDGGSSISPGSLRTDPTPVMKAGPGTGGEGVAGYKSLGGADVQNLPAGERPSPGSAGGLSTLAKALLGVGGLGVGAVGASMYADRKRKKEKQVTASDVVNTAVRKLVLKKAAALYKEAAARQLTTYLDQVIAGMPLEKTAQLRTLQASVAAKVPLSHAIKTAFPHLNGEERGIFAHKLVQASLKKSEDESEMFGGKKKQPFKVVSRSEATCKPGDMAKTMKKMK